MHKILSSILGPLCIFWGRGSIGTIFGIAYGLYCNPPFPGLLDSSDDVRGLTIASWFIFGFIGGAIGTFLLPAIGIVRKIIKGKGPNHIIKADEK